MLTRNRFGVHAVVRHDLSLLVATGLSGPPSTRQVHRAQDRSILSQYVQSQPDPHPMPLRHWGL
jgi:hypothetical protein